MLAVTEVDGEPRTQPAEPEEAERRLAEVQPSAALSRGWFAARPWAVGVGIAVVLGLIAVSIPVLRSEAGGPIDVGTNSIARLNGADGSLGSDPTALGERPGASAIGFGSLWVAKPDQGVVARVSLEDGSVTDPNIEVGSSPAGIAIGEGSVWVTNAGDGTVMRIDPGTGDVTEEMPVGTAPSGIAFGDGALWITDSITAELIRLDPNSSGEPNTVQLAGRPSGVAFTPNGVWVAVAPAGVARVDPADPTNLTVTLAYKETGNGPTAVLSAFESIWVANHLDGTVSRVDPSTAIVKATIPAGEGPNALAATGDSVWVANESDGSITAIDPVSGTTAQPVAVGSAAISLVADGDDLWLATGASATEHRGGTLVVASSDEAPPSLDPASVVYADEIAGQILSITNDGLLSFKKVGGAEGATLVPDLASALPEVSADRLSYRFPLREGVRYSTGDPVRPEDFRYALERAVSLKRRGGRLLQRDRRRERVLSTTRPPAICRTRSSSMTGPSRSTSRGRIPTCRSSSRCRPRSRSRPPRRSRTRDWRPSRRRDPTRSWRPDPIASNWCGTKRSNRGPPGRSPRASWTRSRGVSGKRRGRPSISSRPVRST